MISCDEISYPAILKNYLFLRIFCLFYLKYCLFRPNFIKQKYDDKFLNTKMTEKIIIKKLFRVSDCNNHHFCQICGFLLKAGDHCACIMRIYIISFLNWFNIYYQLYLDFFTFFYINKLV